MRNECVKIAGKASAETTRPHRSAPRLFLPLPLFSMVGISLGCFSRSNSRVRVCACGRKPRLIEAPCFILRYATKARAGYESCERENAERAGHRARRG